MPRRRVGLCRPAFVYSLFYLFGSWSYGRQRLAVYNWKTAPMYAPDGKPRRHQYGRRAAYAAGCIMYRKHPGPAARAGWQASRAHYRPLRRVYAARQYSTHTARKKCEQRARGGATTAQRRAHRREGVGGAFLSFYALQTSPCPTLHARNFFQKSQLYRLRI